MANDQKQNNEKGQVVKQKRWVYLLKVTWLVTQVLFVLLVMGLLFAGGVSAGYFASFVHDEPIRSYEEIKEDIYNIQQTGEVYFKNNEFIGYLRTEVHRQPVDIEEVSPHLIDAILATEDNEFFEHKGINIRALGRAVLEELSSPGKGTGGSTVTQQLVKNQLLTAERTYDRKFNELLLAMRVERMFSKEDILEAYINVVYLGYNANGTNIEGVGAAAEGVFGVSVSDLNIAQSAYIAGMIQSPGRYTPFNRNGTINEENLERGLVRMNYVLERMLETGRITQQEYNEALAFDIKGSLAKPEPTIVENYPYLTFAIEEAAIDILLDLRLEQEGLERHEVDNLEQYWEQARQDLFRGGYKIYTTIDKELYEAFQRVVAEAQFGPRSSIQTKTVEDPETGEEKEVGLLEQVGGTLIDNQTGAILAMIEGRDYNESQVNFSRSVRQPGSAIKPILDYAPAFELGVLQPASVIDDVPLFAPDGSRGYHMFQNFNRRFHGLVTVRKALEQSYNIPAIKAMEMARNHNSEAVLDYLHKMNLTMFKEEHLHELSGAIGGGGWNVSVEALTAAFATFANEGKYLKPYMIERIETMDGETVYEHQPEPVEIFSPQTAFLITDMLRDVVRSGTASRIGRRLGSLDVAGKTGTTSDAYDYWFVGYTPQISLGLWRGYERNDSLAGKYSERHQELWAQLIQTVRDIRPELVDAQARFKQPEGIVRRTVCSKSGLLPSKLCQQQGWLVTDYFNAKFVPTKTDDRVVEARIITVNGERYLAKATTPDDLVEKGIYVLTEKINYPPGWIERYKPLDWEIRAPAEEDSRQENGKVPAAPDNVQAKRSGGGITVSWSKVNESDLAGYRVYRAGDDGQFKHIASVLLHEGTVYQDSTVSGRDYAYYVTAVDIAGQESEPSAIAVSNAQDPDQFFLPDPPSQPAGLSGQGGELSVQLSWQANPDDEQVEYYQVYYAANAQGPFKPLGQTHGTSYTHTSLAGAGDYWFYVTAVNRAGESPPSKAVRVKVTGPPPAEPEPPGDGNRDGRGGNGDDNDNDPKPGNGDGNGNGNGGGKPPREGNGNGDGGNEQQDGGDNGNNEVHKTKGMASASHPFLCVHGAVYLFC
ncbi:transglycosylase domain-containing protein [Caldalkalibacillus thermarum TA2.A1]|uniref:Transglycosylase domain-containing protein n=1 Tax=Caldalkalibacillus thermarum (strain TA2.A1) TaxID=986075 RepID=A0A8X8I6T7_CALTT|nr:transglycosylase domain-containing protein [Caldalkalibacillus thermarum]QZT35061.1 transglycosylase domain-containing protein [Caldalkalibacillus thermarum TA2.A1]